MNQPAMGKENHVTTKTVRSEAFTQNALLPQAATTSFYSKVNQIGVPLLLVRSVLMYSTRPRA